MIKLAVIDNRIESYNSQIHRFKRKGLNQTVDSSQFQKELVEGDDIHERKVIVFNIQLNGNQGKELIKQIRNRKAKVCMLLSAEATEQTSHEQVLARADWILLKDNINNSLVREINQVINEGMPIDPKVTNRVIKFITYPQIKHWQSAVLLTNREMDIMNLITKGLIYKEIAKRLGIRYNTVKNHSKHIFTKLRVNNRSEAILKFAGKVQRGELAGGE